MIKVTLSEYYDLLLKADWHYAFSDSREEETRGEARMKMLRLLGESNGPEWTKLFNEFYEYNHSGPAWGTAPKPLPTRRAA